MIGVPSGLIVCEGTQTAGELGGTGMNAGAVNSEPEEARSGVSRWPACKGIACGLSCIGARGELEGSRVCSVCGLAG